MALQGPPTMYQRMLHVALRTIKRHRDHRFLFEWMPENFEAELYGLSDQEMDQMEWMGDKYVSSCLGAELLERYGGSVQFLTAILQPLQSNELFTVVMKATGMAGIAQNYGPRPSDRKCLADYFETIIGLHYELYGEKETRYVLWGLFGTAIEAMVAAWDQLNQPTGEPTRSNNKRRGKRRGGRRRGPRNAREESRTRNDDRTYGQSQGVASVVRVGGMRIVPYDPEQDDYDDDDEYDYSSTSPDSDSQDDSEYYDISKTPHSRRSYDRRGSYEGSQSGDSYVDDEDSLSESNDYRRSRYPSPEPYADRHSYDRDYRPEYRPSWGGKLYASGIAAGGSGRIPGPGDPERDAWVARNNEYYRRTHPSYRPVTPTRDVAPYRPPRYDDYEDADRYGEYAYPSASTSTYQSYDDRTPSASRHRYDYD
ncbi:hypothetical protein PLICRDRAFT_124864 [Plicaturopsis crispa FD-325 SS-3]|nr:hypothetical protein PLICRDRAFT_124864 [Plicaturopsis crispa FD-325 SS-3]